MDIRRICTGLVLTPVLLMTFGCSDSTENSNLATAIEVSRPALIETVTSGTNSINFAFPGTVRASQRADISFEIGGKLVALPVAEGQKVSKDEVLAELDKTKLSNDLKSIEAEYQKARSDAERYETLYNDSGSIALVQVEQARTQRDVLAAKVKNARQQLEHAVLKAPFSGTIAQVHVTNFNQIQARSEILKLHNLEELELVINLPGSFITTARDEVEAVAVFDQLPGRRFPVSYKNIVTTAASASESYQVVLKLDNSQKAIILPGMKATVVPAHSDQTTGLATGRVFVSLKAVASDNAGGNYVWTVAKDGTVRKQAISLGGLLEDKVTVTAGLNQGDRIVTAGLGSLREGMKVTPLEQE